MKIDTTAPIRVIDTVQTTNKTSRASAASRGSDRVELSGAAQWLQELRVAASEMPEVRPEEVANAKADVASGRLDSGADLDAAVDALLAGF